MRIFCMASALLVALTLAACGRSNMPTGPDAADLTGRWAGTSTYPNAPFQLHPTQTRGTLRGQYSDGLDRSIAVTGTLAGATMHAVVDFGDAKLNLDGTVLDAHTVQGTMHTSALGNTRFPFTMTR